jgi:hypothetical protein
MGSTQGVLSVVSPASFLQFVPVFLSSVSEPCPYPSCLCLPWRTSFFHCPAARLNDHNPQTTGGSPRLCLPVILPVHTATCSVRTNYKNAVHLATPSSQNDATGFGAIVPVLHRVVVNQRFEGNRYPAFYEICFLKCLAQASAIPLSGFSSPRMIAQLCLSI